MKTAAPVETASMEPSAKARLSASREALRCSTVIKAAERAGMSAGLCMR